MPETSKNEIKWPTHKGDILIRALCTAEDIRTYTFDTQFGIYAQYKSLYTKRESLERKAAEPGANVVLATINPGHIIGFGVLAYPDEDERWAKLGPGIMMEVQALEVCRSWRSAGVAKGILKMLLSHPKIEDKI
ncbi:MAG: hypothetical protein JRI77_12830, partial [Deltaproteobacteria bacterium]|nr:hypothetical protein [Deltaproteobacteria bacterium]